MQMQIAGTALSRNAMWEALSLSFPAMSKRRAEDFSASYRDQGGIKVSGDVELDGLPIFPNIVYDSDDYDGYLLNAFTAWVESRGWGLEMHDVGQFVMFPLSHWESL